MSAADGGLEGLVPLAGEPPSWFAEEVCDVAGKPSLMATEDWSVVSWTERLGDVEAMEAMTANLRARGWAVVESGMEQVVSCVKEGGRCQWLWLSCTEVAGEASVVVQVASAVSS